MNGFCKTIISTFTSTLLCTGLFFTAGLAPAMAADNAVNDEIGAATTIYQYYIENHAVGQLSIETNVAGTSSDVEPFIDNTLNLATRLVPFSYDASIQYYADITPTTVFITFNNREYNDLNEAVQTKIAELAAQASALKTDYEKIKFINDYLVDNCEYLSTAMESPDLYETAFTAYGALIEGKSVCEGYTNSVQLFCEAVGIPCVKVTGTATGGNHIWNAVYLENKWWMLDTTFNDPIGVQDETDRWRYFLIDMDTFLQYGMHQYDTDAFETSKLILAGRTNGQGLPAAVQNISMQNAAAGDVISTARIAAEQQLTQEHADALNKLGLFAGDEGGYRLNDSMTRIEMGVMVMRMNGGITALQENDAYYLEVCPFTDVPAWAKSSIGFLYENNLVAGQSETTFGTGAVTKRDYAVMMLRVLNVDHTYENALAVAVQQGLLTQKQASSSAIATRGDVVNMTYEALQLLEKQNAEAELTADITQDSTTSSAYDTKTETGDNLSGTAELLESDETTADNTQDTAERKNAVESVDEKEEAKKI